MQVAVAKPTRSVFIGLSNAGLCCNKDAIDVTLVCSSGGGIVISIILSTICKEQTGGKQVPIKRNFGDLAGSIGITHDRNRSAADVGQVWSPDSIQDMRKLEDAIFGYLDGSQDLRLINTVYSESGARQFVFATKSISSKDNVSQTIEIGTNELADTVMRLACTFCVIGLDERGMSRVAEAWDLYKNDRPSDSLINFMQRLMKVFAFSPRFSDREMQRLKRFVEITRIVKYGCLEGNTDSRYSEKEIPDGSSKRVDKVTPKVRNWEGNEGKTEPLRLNEDGYIAVPNEGVDHDAFYAHSWEELERLFLERGLQPSDFLIELASMSCHPIVYQELGSLDSNKGSTLDDKSETEPLRLNEDGYIAVPNEGVDHDAFYAHSWEELERLFLERGLQPSDFLIELASMSCHPIVYKQL